MLQTLKNAWKTPDLRKKMLFILFILLLYRIGAAIPVPFVDHYALAGFGMDAAASKLSDLGGIFAYMNLLSGGAMEQATLFALGVSPYINASIIVQLLCVASRRLEALSQQGEEGKKVINKITRFITVAIAIVTAVGYYFILKNAGYLTKDATSGPFAVFYAFVIVACFCAGASLVMWLAERINENGLGNGISLILFANIIATLPSTIYKLYELFTISIGKGEGQALAIVWSSILTVVVVGGLIALTVFIIFITGSERRIPIQYAKRTVGRKMYGGQSSNLPIKLNMTGVMPIIFASSICSLVPTILMLCQVTSVASAGDKANFWNYFYDFCDANGWFYNVMLFILIIAFAYFYITISFNPIEVSNNLQKNGGTIPGIRQGKPTADFISRVLSKITFAGALFLGFVALLPVILRAVLFIPGVETIIAGTGYQGYVDYFTAAFTFGGTSILIVVGVVQETARELESQMAMRSAKGFLK